VFYFLIIIIIIIIIIQNIGGKNREIQSKMVMLYSTELYFIVY